MSSAMVERVALATCSSMPCICKNRLGFEGMPCLERGRAGVEAMLVPTEEMVQACGGECGKWARGVWQTMVEVALEVKI